MANLKVLLADDDYDDCMFFQTAMDQLYYHSELTMVFNGEELMSYLNDPETLLPDLLFLDLNMPLKNGYQCLLEIRKNKLIHELPVIIISTSFETDIARLLYSAGVKSYIKKPNDARQLERMICSAISMSLEFKETQPSFEEFVILSESLFDERC